MPNAAIENMAKKAGKSVKEMEELWKKAKREARKQDFSEKDEDSDAFYAYSMGILKKMTGLTKESIDEFAGYVRTDPVLRLKRIVEFTGDEPSTLVLWDNCKTQSLAWQKSSKASKEDTINYAFGILEAACLYTDSLVIKEGIFGFGEPNTDKQRKKIDKNIKSLLNKEEFAKLKSDGYDIKDISDDELEKLETQLKKIKKDKNTPGFAGLIGTVALGFVGGIAAGKAIQSFFKVFKTK